LQIGDAFALGCEMLERSKFYINLPYNAILIKNATLNLFVYMVIRENYAYARYFEIELNRLLSDLDMELKISFHIFKTLASYKQEKSPELLVKLRGYVQVLKDFECGAWAERLAMFLERYGN
jgi:Rgg/GadR/MutR family transcriptional activator